MVLAPPGSGKTKLLVTKLAATLASPVMPPPRGAACITMTNEAALELRRRLRSLGIGAVPNLFIGTVHSFALGCVVAPFAAAAGMEDLASSKLASTEDFEVCFRAAYLQTDFTRREQAGIRAATARARQRLDLSGNLKLGGPKVAALARILQSELESRRLYDFQDLVRHAVQLVEDNVWIRKALAATYPMIFVDEYQDLAPGLDRIVRALTLDSEFDTTLFAVGDPDQAIYAFSGAHPELLLNLSRELAVKTVSLTVNYRSGQDLINVANRLTGTRTVTGQRSGGSVTITSVAGDEHAQAKATARVVAGLIDGGTLPDQIAILAPWASDRDRCVAELRMHDVPVFSRTDDYWRTTPVTTLIESLAAWSIVASRPGISLSELLESLHIVTRRNLDHADVRSVVAVLLTTAPTQDACFFVEQIVDAALTKIVKEPRPTEDQAELSVMLRALENSPMTVSDLGARARAPGHVLASTIHGAKGLEFDSVVVVGADDAALYGFSPNPEEVSEARRKFYVSITRARESVDILYPDRRTSKAGNVYRVRPSPFLRELEV